jgi:hypothetical protein
MMVISLVLLGRVERALGLKGRRHYRFKLTLGLGHVPELQEMFRKAPNAFTIVEMETLGEKAGLVIECDLTRAERHAFKRLLMKLSADFRMLDD